MDNTQAIKILTEEKSWESDDKKIDAFILGIKALEKIEKLNKLSNLFEKTFDWGCNDNARDLYTNAVYAVISEKKVWEGCVEEFTDFMAVELKEIEQQIKYEKELKQIVKQIEQETKQQKKDNDYEKD